MKQFVSFVILSILVITSVTPAFSADTPCTIIYGGGMEEDGTAYCLEAISTKGVPTPTPGYTTPNPSTNSGQAGMTKGGFPSQSKGGFPVQTMPRATTTPNTGPEMLAVFGLIPALLGGWYLRKKA